MNGRTYGFGTPGHPLLQALSALAFGVLLFGALLMGAVLLSAVIAAGLVAIAVFAVRGWWLRRRFLRGAGPRPPDAFAHRDAAGGKPSGRVIEADYVVLGERRTDRAPRDDRGRGR